ncbi:MAG: hypothetical protein GY874_03455 [Desulfobacteraceae bacterium]|nr:hypothetical protein [Desulfobacteraceae bacterium]
MLAQALEAEIEIFISQYRDLTDEMGRQRIVRNGHLPEREIQTGIGAQIWVTRRPRARLIAFPVPRSLSLPHKEKPSLEEIKIINELRMGAMQRKGYVSGETLVDLNDHRRIVVISVWANKED